MLNGCARISHSAGLGAWGAVRGKPVFIKILAPLLEVPRSYIEITGKFRKFQGPNPEVRNFRALAATTTRNSASSTCFTTRSRAAGTYHAQCSSTSSPAWSKLCARRRSASSSVRETSWAIRAGKTEPNTTTTGFSTNSSDLPLKFSSPHLSSLHVLTGAQRTRVHFCPQHWLLCHLGVY
jgi:hypothetical protein